MWLRKLRTRVGQTPTASHGDFRYRDVMARDMIV